jgi:predicted dehydrogenase
VRLGLLSTADINQAILAAAAGTDAVEVVAVGSRSAERAAAYAREHGLAHAHGSYEALLADDEVDAVYVSVPNGLHAEWTLRALEAGKHVLVEKPFSDRVAEVERCHDEAQARGLVLTEGFMWRHHPQADELVRLVREGAVGDLRLVRAWFSFPLAPGPDPRWDPALAGGSLMDLGCYCVSAARLLAGEPDLVVGAAFAAQTGVDVRFAVSMWLPSGALANFDCGFDMPERHGLEAVCAEGSLLLRDPWHCREPGIEVHRRGGGVEHIAVEPADPYRRELEDLAEAIAGAHPPRLGREDAIGQARVLGVLRHG